MENSFKDLHLRFQSKGFSSIEIKAIIKDVLKALGNGGHRSRSAVNREMEDLGWGIGIIDSVTYNLAKSQILFGTNE